MKKILALVMAGMMIVSSSICVCATDSAGTGNSGEGSVSPKAEIAQLKAELEAQKKAYEKLEQANKTQSAQISALIEAVKATANSKQSAPAPSRGSSGPDYRNQQLIRNNAVSFNGNIIGQGGHVEINGGRSNVTFVLGVPDGGTLTSANTLAGSVKGGLINCVTVSSTVGFRTARVNFYMPGVVAGDTIAVYQLQNGKWVQLPTAEIRKDHVVVDMTRYGTLAFIRVPVLAAVTG